MKLSKKDLPDIPVASLLIANAMPVWGVLFVGWDAFYIVLLYWTENIVVGFYNVLKIVFAGVSQPAAHLGKLFLIPFFIVHYGGFTAVHGFFTKDKALPWVEWIGRAFWFSSRCCSMSPSICIR